MSFEIISQAPRYEINQHGVKHTATDIIIEQIEFAGGKRDTRDKDFGGEPVDDSPF